MSHHEKWLRQAAAEIRKEGHAGWGNTCEDAANAIKTMQERIEELKKENDLIAKAFQDANSRFRIRIAEMQAVAETNSKALVQYDLTGLIDGDVFSKAYDSLKAAGYLKEVGNESN